MSQMHFRDDCPSSLSAYSTPDALREVRAALALRNELEPGRIVFASREIFHAVTDAGDRHLVPSGRLRESGDLPVVGDWVGWRGTDPGRGIVEEILPRRGVLSRRAPGEPTREQVVASGLDTVFIVMGLDADWNVRRFERLVVLVRESGAQPVGVLTKRDLHPDAVGARLDLATGCPGVPVVAVNALDGEGLEPLRAWLRPGETVALVGSSGVGKSTLVNALFGRELRRTGAVRGHDGRGRHTTTDRQLVRHPDGALLIDNPGMREVRLWADEGAVAAAFSDLEDLAATCRFRDCAHEDEPGCAVRAAVEDGSLSPGRLASWSKLHREVRHLELRQDEAARRARDRETGKLYRRILNAKRQRQGDR